MYVGVEIGGTKLQAAVGRGDGELLSQVRTAVVPSEGRAGICRQIETLVPWAIDEAGLKTSDVAGVGIGFGGPVDSASGRVVKSHQIEGWDDFPIVAWCRQAVGLPAVLGNDSDMAGWAEAVFGAGRGADPVVYMNIGSGIGGAIVVGGKLYEGQGIGAAEIGHLRMAPGEAGEPWWTLEDVASGWALDRAAREIADEDSASPLWKLAGSREKINASTLVEAAKAGDEACLAVWNAAVGYWAVAIANVTTLLSPQRVVMGGGVALVGDFLFEPLRAEVRRQSFGPFRDTFTIVPAGLGESVVLHGALRLAREGFPDSRHS